MRATALLTCLILAMAAGRLTGQRAALAGTVHLPDVLAAGAVVALQPEEQDVPPEPAIADTALIDQFELRFQPSVLPVRPGTTVFFRNSDPVLHNVFSPPGPGAGFNLGTYPRPGSRARRFDVPGVHVILCHVHPEMAAYVTVVLAPYFTVTDSAARFSFPEIAPGRYLAQVWVRRRLRIAQPLELLPGDRRVVELNTARRGEPR